MAKALSEAEDAPSGVYNAATDMLQRNLSAGRGGKAAFIDADGPVAYADLAARCDAFANVLRARGIGRERRIALILLDTVDFPTAFLGAIKVGIVPVPLNTMLTPDVWKYMIEDSRAEAVVISADLYEKAEPVLKEIATSRPLHVIVSGKVTPHGTTAFQALLTQHAGRAEAASTHAEETAFWLYSSGSTGAPKGTRHLHASPWHTARCFAQGVLGFSENDVVYSAAKLFFAYGLGNALFFPMFSGGTAALLPDRPTPDAVLAQLKAYQPTIFCGVPTLFAALLAHPALGSRGGSDRLKLCVSAGEALPEDIGDRWQAKVGCEIIDGIGSTEMLHIFVSNRPGDVRYGTSGMPVPGYSARLLDDAGAEVAAGEIGELVIRGPSAAEGYWLQREKSKSTFRGGWTHTGDKYRRDQDGYYVYCGRTDDMFKVSGIWVSPFEVESALVTHEAVLEAAVVGKEDADGLLKPKAFVVLRPGVEVGEELFDELKEHVKKTAGIWKYPRWVELRSELPKTATGKIQRFKLRAE